MGPSEGRRFSAAKLINAGKFAVESALSQVGLQLYDIVKGQPKKKLVMVEEINDRRQQSIAPAFRNEDEDDEERLKRLFDEPLEEKASPEPSKTQDKRKVFIRSRL
ncbi:hypothetical protein SASPL_144347 [Salvia splendens]|uniref:Uncharacterized protein n=1 Tax=Salvia splendens TaxID=180675 RepID=A0A8X8Z6P5_SALSN|nr:uncharacterized protein LOC121773535 [Salvia splendens]KAG6393776.1 hypothetical protein SASPL_144347 [Salvia splendens]